MSDETKLLDVSVRLLKAFADPVRLRLLHLLQANGEVCVCHLQEALELPQPTISRHLAYMRKRGVVLTRKDGLWVYYRLAKPQGNVHWMLIAGLNGALESSVLFQRDRDRLARAVRRASAAGETQF